MDPIIGQATRRPVSSARRRPGPAAPTRSRGPDGEPPLRRRAVRGAGFAEIRSAQQHGFAHINSTTRAGCGIETHLIAVHQCVGSLDDLEMSWQLSAVPPNAIAPAVGPRARVSQRTASLMKRRASRDAGFHVG